MMYDKETEAIIAYVKESKNGRRWTDFEKEFTIKREWSKGKFVSHWKEAKQYLEKVADPKRIGRFRYQVKRQFSDFAEKASVITKIDAEDIWKVKLSKEEIMEGVKNNYELIHSSKLRKIDFWAREKLSTKENIFFKDVLSKEFLAAIANKYVEVWVSYPSGTKQPNIEKDDIGFMLSGPMLGHAIHNPNQEFSLHIHHKPISSEQTNEIFIDTWSKALPKWLEYKKIDVTKLSDTRKHELLKEFMEKSREYFKLAHKNVSKEAIEQVAQRYYKE